MCIQAAYDAQGHTPITNASRYGNMNQLIPLVTQGYDINQPSTNGVTPILWACRYGRIEAFEYLLAHGAYLEYDEAKRLARISPYGGAILDSIKWMKIIVELLNKMAEAEQSGRLIISPDEYRMLLNIKEKLKIEAKRGNDGFFCSLIHRGVTLKTVRYDERCIVEPINYFLINTLVQYPVTELRYILPSILMYAAIGGCREAVKLILSRLPYESPVLEQEDEKERTALMYACQTLHCDIAQMLIDHGADLHKADSAGRRARDYAVLSMSQRGPVNEDFLQYLEQKDEEQRQRRGY